MTFVVDEYRDLDEVEENLYLEFQHIVDHVSKEITEKVMVSIVSTPLDEIYKKYETQIPVLQDSTEAIQSVSKQMQETKEDLYENVSKMISQVSQHVLEDEVFKRLETLKYAFEEQIPLVDANSNSLKQLVKEINYTKDELYYHATTIIRDVSNEVIEKEILNKFTDLYEQQEVQLPKMQETTAELEAILSEIEEARKNLYNTINNVYTAISNRILEVVNEKLTDIYNRYNKNIDVIRSIHNEMVTITGNLRQTNKELEDTIEKYQSELQSVSKELESVKSDSRKMEKSIYYKLESQNKLIIGAGVGLALLTLIF